MSAALARAGALVLLGALPAWAQRAPAADTLARPLLDRVSVSASYGELRPAGGSELFSLLDRALAPGARPLRPRLAGGAMHLRVTRRWSALLGVETGGSTVASVSRVAVAGGYVRQRTSLELTAVQQAGAEWQALRWRGAGADRPDRARVLLGAGGGVAQYRLRQWGDFVDAERTVAFSDDLGSTGRGGFAFASAAVEMPLRRRVALRAEVARRAGSAPMSADFAGFDRLDLGGTKLGVGVRLQPAGR